MDVDQQPVPPPMEQMESIEPVEAVVSKVEPIPIPDPKPEPEPVSPRVICSNCCEPLSVNDGTVDIRKAVFELLQGPDIIKISCVLDRVLKLSHLKDAFLEEGLEENTPLCPSCANILGHLNVLYTEFLRVQSFESYLSKKIDRLDEIIRRNVAVVEVHPEIEFDTVSNPESYTAEAGDVKVLKKPTSIKENVLPSIKLKEGPWVSLKRLRPRDIQRERERLKKSAKAKARYVSKRRIDSDELSSDSSDDGWKKRPRKRLVKKAKVKVKVESTKGTKTKKRKAGEDGSSRLLAPKVPKKKTRRGGFFETFFKRKMVHPFPCIYCLSDFDSESDRVEHLKETHCQVKTIICGPCGKVFSKETEKQKHEPRCGYVPPNFHPPPYICPKCGKEFETWLSLSGHVRQVCSDRRFFCDQCSFTAKTNGVVLAHKRSCHEVTEKVPCSECNKMFKTEKHLKWHFKHMHTLEGREKYQGYQQKAREKMKQLNKERQAKLTPFCTECNIDFQTVHRFINHYNAVHETKKWQCEQCGKSFAKAKVFRKHVRITHSDARPYVCDQCGNSFKSMTNLQTHLYRVHTEEGRLKNNEYYRESRRKRQKVVEALSKAGLGIGIGIGSHTQKPPEPVEEPVWDVSFLNRPSLRNCSSLTFANICNSSYTDR
ncbi:unnamed protein product [Allacma fusca]|uniref:C2H2-type domain-containing protein n=1 Tax=Allacma fusca TaxID=39272 RepID=A0A8J2PT31_9HEXA|nr:unnamed protein product [Allacma fusca]